jgi:mannose-6-phosphate isomerase-like protein (cupin superfamily)
MPVSINLQAKLAQFTNFWSPKTVATFNDLDIMVVKVLGEFQWHSHADTDDFFLVLQGRLRIDTDEGTVELAPGELYVVPKGMRHRPVADAECHLLLIEPTGTPNTGDATTAAPRVLI